MWFILGVNLAPLVRGDQKVDNVPTYVRILAQLMEEYDYYMSNHFSSSNEVNISLLALI